MSKHRVFEVFQTEMFYPLCPKMHKNMMSHCKNGVTFRKKGQKPNQKRIQNKLADISGCQKIQSSYP